MTMKIRTTKTIQRNDSENRKFIVNNMFINGYTFLF